MTSHALTPEMEAVEAVYARQDHIDSIARRSSVTPTVASPEMGAVEAARRVVDAAQTNMPNWHAQLFWEDIEAVARALLALSSKAETERAEERERCAKAVESLMSGYDQTGWALAALESAAFHIRSLPAVGGAKARPPASGTLDGEK